MVCWGALSETLSRQHFLDHVTPYERMFAMQLVADGDCGVDTEQVINRRDEFFWRDGSFERVRGVFIGAAQLIAGLDPRPSEDDRVALRPVVAAPIARDARRTTKFAHPNYEGFIEQGSPYAALSVWVTKEQEGSTGECVLCSLLLLHNPDAQSSVRATPPNCQTS